jgi:hypothetical protein
MIMISIITMIETVTIIKYFIKILLAMMMEKNLTVRIYPRYECIVIARYNRSIDQEDTFIISVIRECRE